MSVIDTLAHDRVAARLQAAIRLYIPDAARRRSVSEVSGINERTLKSYQEGATPGLHVLLALSDALGPAFVSDLFSMIGMYAARTECQPAADQDRLTRLLAHASQLSQALEDGFIDHREHMALAPQARELGTALIEFAGRAKA